MSRALYHEVGVMLGTHGLPNPGLGHRHLPHLAAGLRLGDYATQPKDFSACYLSQEDPFE